MQSRRPPTRRHPQRRRKRTMREKLIGLLLIVVAAIFLYYAISIISVLGIKSDRFYEGVYVNGIKLEGYTLNGANALFDRLMNEWKTRTFTLRYGDDTWEFSPQMVNADLNIEEPLSRAWNLGHVGGIFSRRNMVLSLRDNPVYLISNITYDDELMQSFIASIQAKTDIPAQDAEIVLAIDAPQVVKESANGFALDVDYTLEALMSFMKTGAGDSTLKIDIVRPNVSSDEVYGGLQIIGQCTTSTEGSSTNRRLNIKRALDYFNGVAVYPGQQVSFNDVVGKRTVARGFKEAPEYSEGEVVSGIGGGTCQASTTLYGALLQAGMTIVRRSPHSMTVAYVNASMDAAVTETSSKDLVFRNDTDSTIYIYTYVSKPIAQVTIYGNRPEYRYEMMSVILEDNIFASTNRMEQDTTGEFAYYTDEIVLYAEGKPGRRSEGWRISYDWDTGVEVERQKLSTDTYKAGVNVYYVGVNERLTTAY